MHHVYKSMYGSDDLPPNTCLPTYGRWKQLSKQSGAVLKGLMILTAKVLRVHSSMDELPLVHASHDTRRWKRSQNEAERRDPPPYQQRILELLCFIVATRHQHDIVFVSNENK